MQASARVRRIRRRRIVWERKQDATSRRAVGYLRVSTSDQAAPGFGLAAQKRHIREFAKS